MSLDPQTFPEADRLPGPFPGPACLLFPISLRPAGGVAPAGGDVHSWSLVMFDPMALCPEKVRTLYSMMRYMLALWTWHHPSVNGLSFKGSNRNRRVFFGGFQKPGWRCAFRCRSGSGICEAPPKSGLFHLTSWDNL